MKQESPLSDPGIQIKRQVLSLGLAEFRLEVSDPGLPDKAHALALALAHRLAEYSSNVQVAPRTDGPGFEVRFKTDKKNLSKLDMGALGREAVLALAGDD
ncbi:MAG: hypothetical protein SVS15_03430 [Thermodesulfobacteriota bacterium]|nr:hypothetical protein [Thermodesulfobacteriota bacterium]